MTPALQFQFGLHYSWSTEARARRALANVSALLRPGGIFIGTMPDANVIIKRLRECMSESDYLDLMGLFGFLSPAWSGSTRLS